jgi:hypothetical protein
MNKVLIKKNRSNHNHQPEPGVLKGIVSTPEEQDGGGFQEDAFKPLDFGSLAKDFIEPGKTPAFQLFRSILKHTDPPDPRVVVRCLRRYRKFNDKGHEEMMMDLLSSTVSIDGVGRTEMLQARTGMLAINYLEEVLRSRYGGKEPKRQKDDRRSNTVYVNKGKVEEDNEG